jgi:hypothetical protein
MSGRTSEEETTVGPVLMCFALLFLFFSFAIAMLSLPPPSSGVRRSEKRAVEGTLFQPSCSSAPVRPPPRTVAFTLNALPIPRSRSGSVTSRLQNCRRESGATMKRMPERVAYAGGHQSSARLMTRPYLLCSLTK